MSTFKYYFWLLAPVLFTFLWAGRASATSVPSLSFEQLVDESDAVVTGSVERTWTEWDPSHTMIWTRSEVAVAQLHKGSGAKTVVINEPGGEVGGVGVSVAGSVRYQTGEKVLIFLKSYPGLGYRTHGWGQGKYVVDGRGRLHSDESVHSIETTPIAAGNALRPAGARVAATRRLDGISLSEAEMEISARARRGAVK